MCVARETVVTQRALYRPKHKPKVRGAALNCECIVAWLLVGSSLHSFCAARPWPSAWAAVTKAERQHQPGRKPGVALEACWPRFRPCYRDQPAGAGPAPQMHAQRDLAWRGEFGPVSACAASGALSCVARGDRGPAGSIRVRASDTSLARFTGPWQSSTNRQRAQQVRPGPQVLNQPGQRCPSLRPPGCSGNAAAL